MKTDKLSSKLFRRLTLAAITTACMFASTSHAAFIAESQACKSDAAMSFTSGVGNYYFPSTRIAVTHQVNETFTQTLSIKAELWAYPEGGGPSVFNGTSTVTSIPGVPNNHATRWYTNSQDAPGNLTSVAYAWHPTMSRWNGTYISPYAPFNENKCRTAFAAF